MTYKAIVENMIKAKAVEKVETTLGENGYRFSEAEIKSIENNNTVFPSKDFAVKVITTTVEWTEREFDVHGWVNENGYMCISIIWEHIYDKGFDDLEIFWQ